MPLKSQKDKSNVINSPLAANLSMSDYQSVSNVKAITYLILKTEILGVKLKKNPY